jgi:hypothetical protein
MRGLGCVLLVWAAASPAFAQETTETPPGAPMGTPPVPAEDKTLLESVGDHRALLEQLEGKIDALQLRIVAAQEKVDVLRDTVLEGIVSKARSRIVHANDMKGRFLLSKATYTLDGGVIFDREDVDGSLSNQEEIVLFDGPITPGEHEIKVSLVFRVGNVGVFTYAEGYKFKVESRYVMKAVDGRMNLLRIVSHDKGETDVSKQTTDRIGVRYDFEAKLVSDQPKPEQPPQSN